MREMLEMDRRRIIKTIEKSDELSPHYKEFLVHKIKTGIKLRPIDIEFIKLTVMYEPTFDKKYTDLLLYNIDNNKL